LHPHAPDASPRGRYLAALTLGALGIVYGDIGTSPLYALRECFHGHYGLAPTPENVLGVLSLIVWSLILIISIKYLGLVMRADNHGEGGILALMALLGLDRPKRPAARRHPLVILALFGAALMFGDGMITPAISVLSALEGLSIVTARFEGLVVPLTIGILLGLFAVQRRGTGGIARFFGPLTLVWFAVLAALGIYGIARHPAILTAVNPVHGAAFFVRNGQAGFLVLGSVFLVVTGGEALYADMGHFGRRPIRLAWFALVLPALLLNYFGQGALLVVEPEAARNPFYLLAPGWALLPLVVLATVATCIASQAVISGAFSLARQAVMLGYLPRMTIRHTSGREIGQIYVPAINALLLIASIALVVAFETSSNLAAAYGIAVTATMIITTLLLYRAMTDRWGWRPAVALPICLAFGAIDLAFLGANLAKILHGGWVPLVVGAVGYAIMSTWVRGRELLRARIAERVAPTSSLVESLAEPGMHRVPGTAIFLSREPHGVPRPLSQYLDHVGVLHERVVLLTIETRDVPHVSADARVAVEARGSGIWRVAGAYGFMEEPSVPDVLRSLAAHGLDVDPETATYFLGTETLYATRRPGMGLWREHLFAVMSRNAQRATRSFDIPGHRTVELGLPIEL